MRTRRVATAVCAALLLPLLSAPPAQARPGVCVFPAACAAPLARAFPSHRVTAAVYDTRTGCDYRLHNELRLTTASVIKAGVMGAVLLKAQDAGRGLTDWERARIR